MITGVSPILKKLVLQEDTKPKIQAQSPVYIWSDIVLELQFLDQRFSIVRYRNGESAYDLIYGCKRPNCLNLYHRSWKPLQPAKFKG